jgi:hypothetical protein
MRSFEDTRGHPLLVREEGGPLFRSGGGSPGIGTFPPCSVTALHESGHILVGRYFGLPVASATVLASEHFHGQVLAPEADLEATPQEPEKTP